VHDDLECDAHNDQPQKRDVESLASALRAPARGPEVFAMPELVRSRSFELRA
jgi:hypothetical protein